MANVWAPPVALSSIEERVMQRVKKRPLFAFFRRHRHTLFDSETQAMLAGTYNTIERGKERVAPAVLALATLMQAALGVPDHEVPELTVVDQRWQMVLDCVGAERPLFSQGTLYNFRMRCVEHGLMDKLVDRTVQLACETKGYSGAALRAAMDSSPLWGAGRVEDTFNLIGRAASLIVRSVARREGKSESEIAEAAGIPLVTASSIKAGLDLDWSDKAARTQGLRTLLSQVDALRAWLTTELGEAVNEPPLREQLATLSQLVDQDIEPDPEGGGPRIKQGVAPDRRISVHDPDMRHGRKSASKRFDGYKRHVLVDLDIRGLVRGTEVTAGNVPDAAAAEVLLQRAEDQLCKVAADTNIIKTTVAELHVDRAYVDHNSIHERRAAGLRLVAKAHPVGNGDLYAKTAFRLDLDAMTATCPADHSVPIRFGTTTQFPATICDKCHLRQRCTTAKEGRSLRIHEHEKLQSELRANQATVDGRAEFRRRVAVEHSLARIGQTQGTRARYRGIEKNRFDLARHGVLSNCAVLGSAWAAAA